MLAELSLLCRTSAPLWLHREGLCWSSVSGGSPSDPPYLVLRHLAFLKLSFLKKITDFMKVEIRC